MSSTNYTHPNVNIDVIDKSVVNQPVSVHSRLHVPLFPIFGSMGESYKIFYGTGSEIQETFGDDVFDVKGPNATHANLFASYAVGYQAICVVRVNGTTTPAFIARTLKLSFDKSSGSLTLDSGTVNTKAEASQFGIDFKTNNDTKIEAETVLFSLTAKSGGSAYNNYGIILSTDNTYYSDQQYVQYKASVVKNTASGIIILADKYGNTVQTGLLTSSSVKDEDTAVEKSLVQRINKNYNIPVTFELNDDALQILFNDLTKLNPDMAKNAVNPLQFNWLTGKDSFNWFHTVNSTINFADPAIMLTGGTDDNIADSEKKSINAKFDDCVQAYLDFDSDELYDQFRFPFTHFYDSGYRYDVKAALTQLYKKRDDLIIDFSTYSISNKNNKVMDNTKPSTYEEDLSEAAQISVSALTPESELYGTGFMRGNIFGQTGTLASNLISRQIPYTLNTLLLRCKFHAGSSITGQFTPRPNNEVTAFKDVSYTLSSPDQKEEAWVGFLNLVSYADTTVKFYPDFKSMYKTNSSLLSSTMMVDYIVYVKKIIRNQWTYVTGSTLPVSSMAADIRRSIDTEIHYAFNGAITSKTEVTQTVSDQVNGHSVTITCEISSGADINIWNVIIPVTITDTSSSSES